MNATSLLSFATALVALLSAGENAAAQDTGLVTVRATPGLPDAAIEYIARIAEPRRFELKANQLPEDVIAAACGATTNSFLSVYDSLNANPNASPRARVPRKRWPKMPACIRWERGVTVTIETGNTLDSILREYIGWGEKARFTCPGESTPPRCNKTFRELVQDMNKGEDLDNLRAGNTILLPFRTDRTTFRVDPSATLSAEQVVAKIAELGQKSLPDSPIIQIDVGQPVRLITPLGTQDPDISTPACSMALQTANREGRPWPYDAALVARVLARNAARVKELGQATNPVTVTIIDTGLDPSFVPEALLSRDGTEPGSPFGIGTYIKNWYSPFADHKPREVRMHGSQVAAILTGAPDLRDAILKSPVRLKIVNIVERLGNDDYGVTASGVERGMTWAKERSQIANVSIGSETELKGFLDALRNERTMLAVVAAGNDKGLRLGDDISLYPAVYGGTGDAADQVITVAAHDASLGPAAFSNRGKRYADIMAPGCEVPFRSGAPGLYGTSFAAPIVSMTAGLLRAFGVGPKAPLVVKRRLEVSTDFDPGLENDVLSSGRLNIAKALSVYDDTLERTAAPLQFGRWQTTPDLDICDDNKDDYKPVAIADIKKITRVGRDDALRIRILHADKEGKLSPDECSPAGDGLKFATLDDRGVLGQPLVVPWKELIDVVPRYYSSYK